MEWFNKISMMIFLRISLTILNQKYYHRIRLSRNTVTLG